jgi:hypothetical protein
MFGKSSEIIKNPFVSGRHDLRKANPDADNAVTAVTNIFTSSGVLNPEEAQKRLSDRIQAIDLTSDIRSVGANIDPINKKMTIGPVFLNQAVGHETAHALGHLRVTKLRARPEPIPNHIPFLQQRDEILTPTVMKVGLETRIFTPGKRVLRQIPGSTFHNVAILTHESKSRENPFFQAINEAFTEFINLRRTIPESNISLAGMKFPVRMSAYSGPRKLFERIIYGISEKNFSKKSREEIIKIFFEAYTHGWTKELKSLLLKTYGPNTLRVLSILKANKPWSRFVEHNLIIYFNTHMSEPEREKAARAILHNSKIPLLIRQADKLWRTAAAQKSLEQKK